MANNTDNTDSMLVIGVRRAEMGQKHLIDILPWLKKATVALSVEHNAECECCCGKNDRQALIFELDNILMNITNEMREVK